MKQTQHNVRKVTVLQSHRAPLPHSWISTCVQSVKTWTAHSGFDYRWLDNQLFDLLDPKMRERTAPQPVVASDLARLMWCEHLLAEGSDVVIWCDADVLIPWPERFRLSVSRDGCGVGREHWVQSSDNRSARVPSMASAVDQPALRVGNPIAENLRQGHQACTPKVYRKVHNAFMWFGCDNTFLPFYRESAGKLLQQHAGPWVSQFIGPKLLTALHNIVGLPVIESAAVTSPAVVHDILHFSGTPGAALKAWASAATLAPLALNLCASSVRDSHVSDAQMSALIVAIQNAQHMPGFNA